MGGILIQQRKIVTIWFLSLFSILIAQNPIRVNGERLNAHMDELSIYGKNDFGGISRVAYSLADLSGRKYVIQLMKKAGLEVNIDPGGNIIATLKGKNNSLSPIAIGSHIDSVPEGGNYDGNVGSLSAIEVAQTILEKGVSLNRSLIIIIFQNEEGGLFGSKVMTTGLTSKDLELISSSGLSIRDGINKIGGNVDNIQSAKLSKGDWAAYVELHIEQGGILDDENIDIGIVQGIVGIKQWDVTVTGFSNHAGTTPMDKRKDALYAAAQYVQVVHEIGKNTPGRQVATVGKIQSHPGAPNVVPGLVKTSLEIRDLDGKKINSIFQKIKTASAKIARQTQTTFKFEPTISIVPQPADRRISRYINLAVDELKLSNKYLLFFLYKIAIGFVSIIFISTVFGYFFLTSISFKKFIFFNGF